MEMLRLDRSVRDWKNDKCVSQSIRSCQADGKLESAVTLRQIDTIRSTKMNSRRMAYVCVRLTEDKYPNHHTHARSRRRVGKGEEDVKNENGKAEKEVRETKDRARGK